MADLHIVVVSCSSKGQQRNELNLPVNLDYKTPPTITRTTTNNNNSWGGQEPLNLRTLPSLHQNNNQHLLLLQADTPCFSCLVSRYLPSPHYLSLSSTSVPTKHCQQLEQQTKTIGKSWRVYSHCTKCTTTAISIYETTNHGHHHQPKHRQNNW